MIDFGAEECFPLAAAAKLIPGREGKPIHVSALYRWIERGVNGTKLEVILIGGRKHVSREALQRFFESCSDHSLRGPKRHRPNHRRSAEDEETLRKIRRTRGKKKRGRKPRPDEPS